MRERERRAELTSNEGFSVVAPIRVIVPSSTCGRIASCCALLKRCTSSMKRIVRPPCIPRRSFASFTAARRSATPAVTALSGTKCARVVSAMIRARVVLPTLAAPRGSATGQPIASMIRRKRVPGPTIPSCPTNSSSARGRIRVASGARFASSRSRAVEEIVHGASE
jgi:hypothetical protein